MNKAIPLPPPPPPPPPALSGNSGGRTVPPPPPVPSATQSAGVQAVPLPPPPPKQPVASGKQATRANSAPLPPPPPPLPPRPGKSASAPRPPRPPVVRTGAKASVKAEKESLTGAPNQTTLSSNKNAARRADETKSSARGSDEVKVLPESEKHDNTAPVPYPPKRVPLVVERPDTYIGQSLVTADSVTRTRFSYDCAKELMMKERLFESGFKIRETDSEQILFATKNNALTTTSRKKLLDVNGNCVYEMRDSRASLHDRTYIRDGESRECEVQIKRKSNIPGRGRRTMEIVRGSDKKPWMEARGDIIAKEFKFIDVVTGDTVATVTRKVLSERKILLGKDSYLVHVNAGIDVALIVMLAAHIDDRSRDWSEEMRKSVPVKVPL